MRRDLGTLSEELFDILVIGGGIHGAAILREAAQRGFKAALVEQGDFGQATSANSLKTIHGGLRYLQQADLRRMRQSITARRRFMAFAPHLVRPQPFLIPVYGHGFKGKETLALALGINDLVSWDRNRNLPDENHIPGGRVVSRKECLNLLPGIEGRGLSGGALWYDGLVRHSERLTLEFILAAWEKGAVPANYVSAEGLLLEKGAVRGIEAKDNFSQTAFPVRARMVVNASGPWLREILPPRPGRPRPSLNWVKGINLIIQKPLFEGVGVGLPEKKKSPDARKPRYFFFIPWQGRMLIGTAYCRHVGKPDQCRLEENEMAEFLEAVHACYPPARLGLEDVVFYHVGLQPLSEGQDDYDAHPEPDRHSAIIDHEAVDNLKGLISVKSTKYTTAPLLAEKVLDRITARQAQQGRSSPLPQDLCLKKVWLTEAEVIQLTGPNPGVSWSLAAEHFHENYGPRERALLNYFSKDEEGSRLISQDPLLTTAEVRYGIGEEMALTLSDIIFRRTSLAQGGYPGREGLQKIASLMAPELGWDETRREREIEAVIRAYRPLRERS
jgi:glycerol-3-phosphate dehydrogenase